MPLHINAVALLIQKLTMANTRVIRNISGPVYQVRWLSHYESLAVLEEIMKKVRADSGYQELIAKARDQKLFISSTVIDSLYETIA